MSFVLIPSASGLCQGNIEYRRSREWSRYNLQLQSSGYRQESGPPDKVCLSYTHDRDYGVFKAGACCLSVPGKARLRLSCCAQSPASGVQDPEDDAKLWERLVSATTCGIS